MAISPSARINRLQMRSQSITEIRRLNGDNTVLTTAITVLNTFIGKSTGNGSDCLDAVSVW